MNINELREKVKNGDFDDNELIDLVIYLERENQFLLKENKKYKEVFDKIISFIDKYAYRPNIFNGQLNLNYDEFKELENILKEVK